MRRLLAAGSNGSAQLGIAHRDDVASFTPCRFAPAGPDLSRSHIVDLASGANHSLLLLSPPDGPRQVWATGTNEYRQLGPQFTTQTTLDVWTPLDVDSLLCSAGVPRPTATTVEYEPIAIGCSWTTSFIAFSRTVLEPAEGKDRLSDIVLSFGTNDFGELGCGIAGNDADGPLPDVNIVRLPGWQDTVHFLSTTPERMHVEQLAVGQRHVICVCQFSPDGPRSVHDVTERQEVYGWGAARHGQLSSHSYTDSTTDPTTRTPSSSTPIPRTPTTSKPARPPPSTKSKPRNKYTPYHATPIPIHLSDVLTPPAGKIIHASSGAGHTVLLLSDGRALGLGNNVKGQLDLPRRPGRCVGIGCTWNGTVGWSSTEGEGDELWSTGSNTHGQLGRTALDSPMVSLPHMETAPPSPVRITKLVCGSEHVLLIAATPSSDGTTVASLYGWGWNEHGNLALGTAEDQWAPVCVPVVVPDHVGRVQVVDAWAGCGTSWVLVELCD